MRWRTVCLDVSLLVVLTGCPRSHMPGGTLDRAAHKDVKEWLEEHGCSLETYLRHCQDKEDSAECLEACPG